MTDTKNVERKKMQLTMRSDELEKLVNEVLDFGSKKVSHPVTWYFVLQKAADHLRESHSIVIESEQFVKAPLESELN